MSIMRREGLAPNKDELFRDWALKVRLVQQKQAQPEWSDLACLCSSPLLCNVYPSPSLARV